MTAVLPDTTLPPCGWITIAGASHGVIVIVTGALSTTAPQELVARTQYEVVAAGCTRTVAPVCSGREMSPGVPRYHWTFRPLPPVASTVSVTHVPFTIAVEAEIELIVSPG